MRLTILALGVLAAACEPGPGPTAATWDVSPRSPSVGQLVAVSVTLRDSRTQASLDRATLQVEAHMAHPGMAPVIAQAAEQAAGQYRAALSLSMAGDWSLRLTGTLRDGRRVNQTLEPAIRVQP